MESLVLKGTNRRKFISRSGLKCLQKKRGNQSSLVNSKVVDWFKISGFSDLSVIKLANCILACFVAIIVKGKKRLNVAGHRVFDFFVQMKINSKPAHMQL